MAVLFVALRVLLVVGAMMTVGVTALSALRTFVLPRAANTFLSRLVFVTIRRGFDKVVRRLDGFERQDALMALFAPVGLLALPVVWLLLVFCSYSLAFWAIDPAAGWQQAFDGSGSSLFTLGFRAPDDFPARLLGFTEAGLGLTLVALLITYLPSIYAAFSKREAAVQKLDVPAGRTGSSSWGRPTPAWPPWSSSGRPGRTSRGSPPPDACSTPQPSPPAPSTWAGGCRTPTSACGRAS